MATMPGGIMRSASSPSCPLLLVPPASSESKKALSELAEAADSDAACAAAPARPFAPSYGGCGAPAGRAGALAPGCQIGYITWAVLGVID
jgi:hypothetical protein